MKYSEFLFCILFTMGSLFSSQLEFNFDSEEYKAGDRGLNLYYEGKFKKAAKEFKTALKEGDGELIFAETYADICYRNLDEGFHNREEAAFWYLKAVEFGCGESTGFLGSIDPNFLNEKIPFEIRLHNLESTFLARDLTINAETGWDFYIQGKYKDAAFYFKMASRAGHCIAQRLLADICFRQLDEEPHSLFEAAQWYLLSARGGDSESYSYLNAKMPGLWQVAEPVEQIRAIVGFWIAEEASNKGARGHKSLCGEYSKVTPAALNNYLIKKFKRTTYKTTAQKLTYFFDKVSSAMIYQLAFTASQQKVNESSEEDEEDRGASSSSSGLGAVLKKIKLSHSRPCLLEVPTSVSIQACAMAAGPVYKVYLKKLNKDVKNGNPIPAPKNLPKIPVYIEFLLAGLHECTKNMNAKSLSALSHMEYPWILAGIEYWESYYDTEDFPAVGNLSVPALRQKLLDGDVIDDQTMVDILGKIEESPKNTKIWPAANNVRSRSSLIQRVKDDFKRDLQRFFASSISINSDIVRIARGHFLQAVKTLNLNFGSEKVRSIATLNSPIVMYYCEDLTLDDVTQRNIRKSSKLDNLDNSLKIGFRYFTKLKRLAVNLCDGVNIEEGSTLEKVKRALEERFVTVIVS